MIMLRIFDLLLGVVAAYCVLLAAVDAQLPRREYFLVGGIVMFILSFMVYALTKQYPYRYEH